GMAKVFHVLARDRDGTYSTSLVREFAGDTKKELLSREINHQNLLAGLRAADHNGPLIPSSYSPTGKKETRLAMATISLFSCGGEGSSQ
ncbi:MAG: hypothetical protein ACKOUR_03730, partial [Planctomycetota bacterium]